MAERAELAPEPGRILALARSDRSAARRAVAALPPESQVALVCEAPLARRAEILELLPEPERVIPALPEAELCFAVKAIGLADASWLLEYATPEQIVASVDLDAWRGNELDAPTLSAWLDALSETPRDALVRAVQALDPELVVLLLKDRAEVALQPAGDDDWQPPSGAQTLDGQFYFAARNPGDDLASVVRLLGALFESDYWTYFRLMQAAIWELAPENEEWALRWRSGRLEDLGFPSWDEAMGLYRTLRPEERARIPEDAKPLAFQQWHLPVWMPRLPAGPDAAHALFRAIGRLDAEGRRAAFHALVSLANQLAVADRMPLSDAESTPRAIEKVARLASAGLEHVASENGLPDAEVLRRVPLQRLFQVGANLDPEGARR